MRQPFFRLPRAYRLKPVGEREDDALSQLRIGESCQSVLVPFSPGLDYVVASSAGQALPIESCDFHVETLGPLASLWARLRLMAFFKKKKYLRYQEFSLFSVGPKAERKRFTGFNQDTRNIGVVVDGDLVANHPSFSTVGRRRRPRRLRRPTVEAASRRRSSSISTMRTPGPISPGALRGLKVPFDLIVTTVAGRERLIETIQQAYPHADTEVVENRGRGRWPVPRPARTGPARSLQVHL